MKSVDKTSDMYRLTKEQYDQSIMNSITSIYKKPNSNIKKQINMAGKNSMRDKETNKEGNIFITTKDYKENCITTLQSD